MKKCPFCSEEIQDDAKKCRFCGEWLIKEEVTENIVKPTVIAEKKKFGHFNNIKIIYLSAICIFFIGSLINNFYLGEGIKVSQSIGYGLGGATIYGTLMIPVYFLTAYIINWLFPNTNIEKRFAFYIDTTIALLLLLAILTITISNNSHKLNQRNSNGGKIGNYK